MKSSQIRSNIVVICLAALTITSCAATKPDATANNPAPAPVEKTAEGAAQATGGKAVDLTAPIAQYKVYATQEIDQLATKTKTFTDAVIAGDLAKAQKLYAPTRTHWERSEPIAEAFSDLDGSMDQRADKFEQKEKDPKFTGWHRLEMILFQDKTTKGTKELAVNLMKDTLELQKRMKTLVIEPKTMVGGAAGLIEEVAANKISGEEDRYSKTDLWDFAANVDGSQKIVELLRPMLTTADPELLKRVDSNFTKVNTGLAKYKTADGGYQTYDKLKDGDRKDLKGAITLLAEDLSKLRGTLGVE